MVKKWIISFCTLLLSGSGCFAQAERDMARVINYLSSPALAGRGIGSEGIEQAENFLVKEYTKAGFAPYSDTKGFRQSYTLSDAAGIYAGTKCTNIIALLDNKADSTVILSAHYDGIGIDEELSKETLPSKKKLAVPGADDNASGVALVLELVKRIKKAKGRKYNIIALHCSAHEAGLLGAEAFFKSDFCRTLKIKEVINLDMVGRLNKATGTIKIGRSAGEQLLADTSGYFKKYGLTIETGKEQLESSDAAVFYRNTLNVSSLTTGIHDDYHRSSDTGEKINYEGLLAILNLLSDELKK